MTAQPTRDQLRALAQDHAYIHPDTILALLDQLAAAEQRIRDLTQEVRDERGAALDQMEQVRVRDARIQAVQDVLDAVDGDYDSHGAHRLGVTRRIRRALEG